MSLVRNNDPPWRGRPRGENVVDLMEALRRSVNQEKTSKPAKKPKAAAGQKEMLLPIAGKKTAKKTGAKKPAAKSQRKSAYCVNRTTAHRN